MWKKIEAVRKFLDLYFMLGGEVGQPVWVRPQISGPSLNQRGEKEMDKFQGSAMAGRIASLYVLYLVCLSQAGEFLTGINSLFFLIPLCGLAFLVLGDRKFKRAQAADGVGGEAELA
jgi:hypothetical protein